MLLFSLKARNRKIDRVSVNIRRFLTSPQKFEKKKKLKYISDEFSSTVVYAFCVASCIFFQDVKL